MNRLQRGQLSVVPTGLLFGRKPKAQIILFWIWQLTLSGQGWTFRDLSEACGVTITRSDVEELLGHGLDRIPKQDRKNSKPCFEFCAITDCVGPSLRPEKEKPTPKPKTYPEWVHLIQEDFKRQWEGFVKPSEIYRELNEPVKEYNIKEVRIALYRFGKKNPDPQYVSMKRFAKEIGLYLT